MDGLATAVIRSTTFSLHPQPPRLIHMIQIVASPCATYSQRYPFNDCTCSDDSNENADHASGMNGMSPPRGLSSRENLTESSFTHMQRRLLSRRHLLFYQQRGLALSVSRPPMVHDRQVISRARHRTALLAYCSQAIPSDLHQNIGLTFLSGGS